MKIRNYNITISLPDENEKVLFSFNKDFKEDGGKTRLHMFHCHKDTAEELLKLMQNDI